MPNVPEQDRSFSGRPTGGSVLNRLVNLAGFWMAVFSLAGLMMLTVAGPIVQQRMSRRSIPTANTTQSSIPSMGSSITETNHPSFRGSSPGSEPYSLDGLRWTLALFFVLGIFWVLVSMLKLQTGKSSG